MKRYILVGIILSQLCWSMTAVAVDSAVYHVTGRVGFFDGDKITLDQRSYYVSKNCRFEKHTRKNGVFLSDPAKARDVYAGVSVVAHINGTVVDQILIEEWKR